MKQILFASSIFVFLFIISGCSLGDMTVNEPEIDSELNQDVATLMEFYAKASTAQDPEIVEHFTEFLEDFDRKYNSNLREDFERHMAIAKTRIGAVTSYAPLADLPLSADGAVYLSGGGTDAINSLITWVAPNVTPAQYVHGAILDLNKFDPTNLDKICLQTAVADGANYETPMNWMTKPNVAVMVPAVALNQTLLNSAQATMDQYCNKSISTKYGFFKNMVNIFSVVSKSDNTYWYCTKVPWRVYNAMGINIDSNSPLIDWTTSGLYGVVKAYYSTIYFWSASKARAKLNEYIANTKDTIVLAEEIYFSPMMSKVYEARRY